MILIGLMTTVGSIGFGPALIRCDSVNASKINTYLSLSGVIGVILSLVLCIFSSPLESLLSVDGAQLYFIGVSPIIAIKLISMVYEAIAQRELKIAQITKIDFYAFLIFHFVFQVIVLTFGLDLIWLVLCVGLEELSKLLLYKKISNIKYYISFRFQEIKDNLSFSLLVTANRIINYLNSQIDKIYVSNQLSAADFSGYGRVFQFINFPINIVGQFFDKIIYPIVCKRLKSSDGRFGFSVFGLVFLMGVLSSFFCLLIGDYVEKFFFSGDSGWIQRSTAASIRQTPSRMKKKVSS